MGLLDLIYERGTEILKNIPRQGEHYYDFNFSRHNQILKTLPKSEQIKIMLKYDRKLLKSYVNKLYLKDVKKSSSSNVKIIFPYVANLYLDFCEYFQTFI